MSSGARITCRPIVIIAVFRSVTCSLKVCPADSMPRSHEVKKRRSLAAAQRQRVDGTELVSVHFQR